MKRPKGMERVRRHDEVPGFITEKFGKIARYLIVSELPVEPPIYTQSEAHELADSIDNELHKLKNGRGAKSIVAPRGDGTVAIHVDNMNATL